MWRSLTPPHPNEAEKNRVGVGGNGTWGGIRVKGYGPRWGGGGENRKGMGSKGNGAVGIRGLDGWGCGKKRGKSGELGVL